MASITGGYFILSLSKASEPYSSRMQNSNQNQQQRQVKQQSSARTAGRQEPSTFQFSDVNFEEPKEQNVVVQPAQPKPRPTGPWSDDLIEDKDDPSWTVVERKRRKRSSK